MSGNPYLALLQGHRAQGTLGGPYAHMQGQTLAALLRQQAGESQMRHALTNDQRVTMQIAAGAREPVTTYVKTDADYEREAMAELNTFLGENGITE